MPWARRWLQQKPRGKTNNVARLVPAWSFSFGDEKQRGQESRALDAKTGERLWEYSHRLPEGIRSCCDVINRGAAIFDFSGNNELVLFEYDENGETVRAAPGAR